MGPSEIVSCAASTRHTEPDKSLPSLALHILPEEFWTFQYPPTTPVPPGLWQAGAAFGFVGIVKCPDELTLTVSLPLDSPHPSLGGYEAGRSKPRIPGLPAPLESHGPWKAIRVRGPMDLSESPLPPLLNAGLKGILHALTGPLAVAEVPIFAISTWNTDYVLIDAHKVSTAVEALRADGWTVVESP